MAKSIKSRVADELRMWPKIDDMPFADADVYGPETVSRLLRLLSELHDEYVLHNRGDWWDRKFGTHYPTREQIMKDNPAV